MKLITKKELMEQTGLTGRETIDFDTYGDDKHIPLIVIYNDFDELFEFAQANINIDEQVVDTIHDDYDIIDLDRVEEDEEIEEITPDILEKIKLMLANQKENKILVIEDISMEQDHEHPDLVSWDIKFSGIYAEDGWLKNWSVQHHQLEEILNSGKTLTLSLLNKILEIKEK